MCSCGRLVPALFLHINILLAMYGGAGLVTAARLKWDPSLYAPVRELWPSEYRAAACMLPLLAGWLLALAHVGGAAAADLRHESERRRRSLLIAYVWLVSLFAWTSGVWAWWTWRRLAVWAGSAQATQLQEAVQLTDHIQPILDTLSKWASLPENINHLIQEVKDDAPRNVYVCVAASALLVLLLACGAGLALLLVCRGHHETAASELEKRPLRSLDRGQLAAR